MEKNQVKKQNLQPIRWQESDWSALADVAQSVGMSRSDFVRSAALHAAQAVKAGVTPYFVGEANASLQNMGASFFSCEADQKLTTELAKAPRPVAERLRSKGRSAP
jgi:hypothetical protein